MMKTILSIFTIYTTLSSAKPGRLLLQQGQPPQFIPAEPVVIPPELPLNPPPPANPPAVGVPPAPANPAQPQIPPVSPPAPPAIPAIPPAAPGVPGIGAPANPGTGQPAIPTWTPPPLPPMNSFQVRTTMECNLPNTSPAGCAGRLTTLNNAGENFQMKCANIGACAAATMTFNYNNAYTERVEMISFSEQYAGYGATVIMDSTNSLRKQYIDKFECKAPGACQDTTVRLIGGSSLNDVNCPMPHFCGNCNIEVCEWGPMGQLLCGTPKPCFNY